MDQFWAPNLPPKSLKSAGRGYGKFWTGCSGNLLVPRRPQDGSRWPRGAQDSPKLAPKSSQDSPKMGQSGLRWGKFLPRCFQKRPNKAFPLPFLSFAFPLPSPPLLPFPTSLTALREALRARVGFSILLNSARDTLVCL